MYIRTHLWLKVTYSINLRTNKMEYVPNFKEQLLLIMEPV